MVLCETPCLSVNGFCSGISASCIATRCVDDTGAYRRRASRTTASRYGSMFSWSMVGESVGQVRNSARSLTWTAGWQQSANSVQEIAVLQQRWPTECRIVKHGQGPHLVVSCPASKNVGISRIHIITVSLSTGRNIDKGNIVAHAIRSLNRSSACSLAYQRRYST